MMLQIVAAALASLLARPAPPGGARQPLNSPALRNEIGFVHRLAPASGLGRIFQACLFYRLPI
jgi:hypothetical protein